MKTRTTTATSKQYTQDSSHREPPRWLSFLLQPWRWKQACWENDSDDDEHSSRSRSTNSLLLLTESSDNDWEHSRNGVILASDPTENDLAPSKTTTRLQDNFRITKDSCASSLAQQRQSSGASAACLLQTIDSLEGCPMNVIYIPPPRETASTGDNLVKPTQLHRSDRLLSFETVLTESEDEEEFASDDEEQEQQHAPSLSKHPLQQSPLKAPMASRASSLLPFRPPRPGRSTTPTTTTTDKTPAITRNDRTNTFSSTTTCSSRHRRSNVSVSPQSVKRIYNNGNTKKQGATGKQPQDITNNNNNNDETTCNGKEEVSALVSVQNDDCVQDVVTKREDDFYQSLPSPPPPPPPPPQPPVSTSEHAQSSSSSQWMQQWVNMKKDGTAHVSMPSETMSTSTLKSDILLEYSPTSSLASSLTGGALYWEKDTEPSCMVSEQDPVVLLEGWVLFGDNAKGSPICRVYLTITESSPVIFLVDKNTKNGTKTATTWAPPCSLSSVSVHVEYHNKGEGYRVILQTNGVNVATIVPLPSKESTTTGRKLHETAQHNAALHLWFVLDSWRRQQQLTTTTTTTTTRLVSTAATTNPRQPRYATWDEKQVCAIERRLLLGTK